MNIHVSSLDPCEVHAVTTVGSKKMAVHDGLSAEEQNRIVDKLLLDEIRSDDHLTGSAPWRSDRSAGPWPPAPPRTPEERLQAAADHLPPGGAMTIRAPTQSFTLDLAIPLKDGAVVLTAHGAS